MVNTNIQGLIPLSENPRGFIAKRHGNFQPGEYKRLSEAEISFDGSIRSRRSVKSCYGITPGSSAISMTNSFGFVGSMNSYSILVNSTVQRAVGPGVTATMWAPTLLPTPAPSGSFHKIVGYFRFNNINYWITLEYTTGVSIKVALYYGNIDVDSDSPEFYDAAYFATLTRADIITILPSDVNFNKFKFNNFFIQGSRLWISTSVGVYFSKATTPQTFTIPDGGFFKFPDQNINWSLSLRDSIYVLCDNTTHVISYATDPNLDSQVVQIADNVGGDHGCVHSDAVYLINQVGIYRVLNNRVDKIMDNEFDVGLDYYNQTLSAFEDYLVVNKYRDINYEKISNDSVVTRTNLVTNPSFNTVLTGYKTTDVYMNRSVETTSSYSGPTSMKCQKKNDKTVVVRKNLNPNGGFDLASITGWSVTSPDPIFVQSSLAEGSGDQDNMLRYRMDDGGTKPPSGDYNHQNVYSPNISIDTPGVSHTAYFQYMLGTSWNFNNTLEVHIEYWDASNNPVTPWTTDLLISEPPVDTLANTTVIFTPPAGTSYIVFRFDIGIYRPWNRVPFSVFFDSVNIELTSTFNASEPYFDGATVDTVEHLYDWSGTAGNSSSTKKGYGGDSDQLRRLGGLAALAVSADKSYTAGVAVFAGLGERNFYIRITQYTAAMAVISSTSYDLQFVPLTTWRFITQEFNTASNCAFIDVEVFSENGLLYNETNRLDGFIVETTETFTGYFDGDTPDNSVATYSWTGVAHASTSTGVISQIQRRLFSNGQQFSPGQLNNTLGYNTYFINMLNGSVHVMDFQDSKDIASRGRVTNVFVNPYKDSSGNYNMFFITNRLLSETSDAYNYSAYPYYMSSFRDLSFVDYAVKSTGIIERYSPQVDIEIDSFTPDGSEYLFKKFRNLFLMAKIPTSDFHLQFGFDDEPYGTSIELTSTVISERPNSPIRIGINQRAKSISIRFTNENYLIPLVDLVDYDVLQISDLRVLWSYTGHPVGDRTIK